MGGPDHPDGEPGARLRPRAEPRRLREGLWPHPAPGEGAGDPALARRDVRPGARGLLGLGRPHGGHGDLPCGHRRPARQGRRDQDLAPVEEKEIAMRRRLPDRRAHVYRRRLQLCRAHRRRRARATFHALLGIFDAIAPAASAALARLAAGDEAGFRAILDPTVPLSRHIFKAPTRFYKTGVVFLAYLNGLQDHFVMVGGQESARSLRPPRRAVPAGRRGACAARSRARSASACARWRPSTASSEPIAHRGRLEPMRRRNLVHGGGIARCRVHHGACRRLSVAAGAADQHHRALGRRRVDRSGDPRGRWRAAGGPRARRWS